VYLRHNQQIANFDYQRLAHVDSLTATRELRGLVQAGLTLQHSTRRWAHYTMNVPLEEEVIAVKPRTSEETVLEYVRKHGYIKRSECMAVLGIKDFQARKLLARMRDQKLLKQEGTRRGARYLLM
jgi:ATP-dependent DNA helicase RecG